MLPRKRTARHPGEVLGTSPEFWMNPQVIYDLASISPPKVVREDTAALTPLNS